LTQTARDYYRVLEIREGASTAELRSAYRRLAKRYHPDAHPNDSQAEQRFKEISEAYAVLRDPAKRRQYDRSRGIESAPSRQEPVREPVRPRATPSREHLLRRLTRAGRRVADLVGASLVRHLRILMYRRRGENIRLDLRVPLEKASLGGRMTIRVRRREVCGRCRGRGRSFCPVCGGTGRTSEDYLIPVDIPAGIEDGTTLNVNGEGNPGIWGGHPGDLILAARIEPHRFFEPKGADVHSEVPIQVAQAILGARIRVRTLEGNRAELYIPPGTQPGTVFRLRGMGMRRNGSRGDQLVRVHVVIPARISERQRELMEAFQGAE